MRPPAGDHGGRERRCRVGLKDFVGTFDDEAEALGLEVGMNLSSEDLPLGNSQLCARPGRSPPQRTPGSNFPHQTF